jgi:hypothetical protein
MWFGAANKPPTFVRSSQARDEYCARCDLMLAPHLQYEHDLVQVGSPRNPHL